MAAIETTDNPTLLAAGAAAQSSAIAATGLALTGTSGAYTLNDAGNAITTLAANTGSINYRQSDALIVGTVGVTGDAVILKAGSANAAGVSTGGQLINNVCTGGIVAPSGRYLAYSGNPGSTTEGVTG